MSDFWIDKDKDYTEKKEAVENSTASEYHKILLTIIIYGAGEVYVPISLLLLKSNVMDIYYLILLLNSLTDDGMVTGLLAFMGAAFPAPPPSISSLAVNISNSETP